MLFGGLWEGSAENSGAVAAVTFARDGLASIAGLARRCQSSGIDVPPRGRVAVHQGFATVGSFGSPSRLESPAVGPVIEAAEQLRELTPVGSMVVSAPVDTALRDDAPDVAQTTPFGEPAHATRSGFSRSTSHGVLRSRNAR